MNFKNILSEVEKADPEVYEQVSGRRDVLKNIGSKVAMAALPFAIGSLISNTASAKTTDAVVDALNILLEQEYMEYAFVRHGNNTGALIAPVDLAGFQAVEAQKKELIAFLIATITTQLGGVAFTPKYYTDPTTNAPYVPAAYDFTASSTYPTVFSNYGTFLMIGQVFSDTGIHLIKGQMAAFYGNKGLLNQMFQMQATKARHASFYRTVRRLTPAVSPEYPAPWITNNIPPSAALQPFYVIEENVQQKNVVITSLTDGYNTAGVIPQISATAAFDEAYDVTTVKSLVSGFKNI